jgi:hypothetical protein
MKPFWIGLPDCLKGDPTDYRYFFVFDHPIIFIDSRGVEWIAPVGTRTDGASIPRLAWVIVGNPLQGPYRPAAAIHDRYYQTHERDKHSVDLMFQEAMASLGTPEWKDRVMYWAVDWFGGRAWEMKGRLT